MGVYAGAVLGKSIIKTVFYVKRGTRRYVSCIPPLFQTYTCVATRSAEKYGLVWPPHRTLLTINLIELGHANDRTIVILPIVFEWRSFWK